MSAVSYTSGRDVTCQTSGGKVPAVDGSELAVLQSSVAQTRLVHDRHRRVAVVG